MIDVCHAPHPADERQVRVKKQPFTGKCTAYLPDGNNSLFYNATIGD